MYNTKSIPDTELDDYRGAAVASYLLFEGYPTRPDSNEMPERRGIDGEVRIHQSDNSSTQYVIEFEGHSGTTFRGYGPEKNFSSDIIDAVQSSGHVCVNDVWCFVEGSCIHKTENREFDRQNESVEAIPAHMILLLNQYAEPTYTSKIKSRRPVAQRE
jgi:hypothetical protein